MSDSPLDVRPIYAPPLRMFLSVSSSIFFGRPRRSIARDATEVLDSHTPRPIINGLEHIPRDGAFVIVANHHHRRNMWIGWVGALVTEAVNGLRPARTPIRIVATSGQRMRWRNRELTIPLSDWLLGRVVQFWQMIPIPADPADTIGQATALKMTLRLLKEGLPVLFFPEGARGSANTLVEALPGTGTFLALASRRAVILPCGIWEDGEQLRAQIAPPITLLDGDDATIREEVMCAIGRLLPGSMHGPYTAAIAGESHPIQF